MTRKPQKRTLITRAKILQAARTLAAEADSLDGLTAEAVATAAGVAKGTVFAHFGDMDGLLSHLLMDNLKALRVQAEKETNLDLILKSDPVSAIVDRMMALIDVIAESQTMLRLFMDNIGVTKGHCAPEFIEHLEKLDAIVVEILAHWQMTEGLFPALRRDRQPDEMIDGLIAFIIHGAILYQAHQIRDMNVIRNRLTRHVEAFLVTSPGN